MTTTRTIRFALLLGISGFIAPLLGCGGGSGNASAAASRGSITTNQTAGSLTSPSASDACSADTFSPNFANLIHPLYHWTRFPVKVYFAGTVVITNPDGTKSDLRDVAMSGFQEWSDVTNGQVVIQTTSDAASADIVVHLDSLKALPTASDILGIEQSTLDSLGNMQHADIKLNTWPGMTEQNIASFQETAAHEFGHALGINGHSDNPADVMYPSHSLYVFKPLSQRDINTFKTAYCLSAGKNISIPTTGGSQLIPIN